MRRERMRQVLISGAGMAACQAFYEYDNGACGDHNCCGDHVDWSLDCNRPDGHDGSHYDNSHSLFWHQTKPAE